MNSVIFYTIISLSSIGIAAAVILYIIAQKFKVDEDPKIEEINEILPGVNCGACGFTGCIHFAEAVAKSEEISQFYCPVGGNDVMAGIAKLFGKEVIQKDPLIAVVRCSGSFDKRKKTNIYDSTLTCAISSLQYSGDTGCQYGCLGLGDCVASCKFDAIYMDSKTGLPFIIEDKCTACGACVKACPKDIIELRKKGPKSRRVYVSCINKEKGAIAKKSCDVACIGCSRCIKECRFDAIKIENFLAYIDFNKCTLCRKCVSVCPTNAILETNFPPKKVIQPIEDPNKNAFVETKPEKQENNNSTESTEEKNG